MATDEMTKAIANNAGIVVRHRVESGTPRADVFVLPCTKDHKVAGDIWQHFRDQLYERGYKNIGGKYGAVDFHVDPSKGKNDDRPSATLSVPIPTGQDPAAFADKLAKDMREITGRNDIPNIGQVSGIRETAHEAEKQTRSSCEAQISSLPALKTISEARAV